MTDKVRANNLARRRGSNFEYRIRRELAELGSYVYKGQAGDVVAGPFIIECKYRANLHGLGEFGSFLEQAKTNAAWWKKQGDTKDWLLATTGGRRGGIQITMDKETFLDLWRRANAS